MLDKLLEENEFLAVYFCKYSHKIDSILNGKLEEQVILFIFSLDLFNYLTSFTKL
jgi:hypothetical protein